MACLYLDGLSAQAVGSGSCKPATTSGLPRMRHWRVVIGNGARGALRAARVEVLLVGSTDTWCVSVVLISSLCGRWYLADRWI